MYISDDLYVFNDGETMIVSQWKPSSPRAPIKSSTQPTQKPTASAGNAWVTAIQFQEDRTSI
jgi:hypothetical protein